MGDDIAVQMTGDAAKLLAALQKVTVRLEQNARDFREVSKAAKQAKQGAAETGDQFEKSFGSTALAQIKSAVAGYMSVNAAVQLLNRSLADKIELERHSASAQVTLASARKDVLRNLAGVKPADVQRVLDSLGAISTETGIEERHINAAMAQALSASGGNIPASQAAVVQAAKFLPDKPEDLGRFAGSLLDLSKITGTTDAKVNQGLLSLVGSLSRVVDPQQQARNIPRALIGATAFGTQGRDAAALFAALTTGAGDVEGATSGTGLVALSQQLEEFLPARLTSAQQADIAEAKAKQAQGRDLSGAEQQSLDLERRYNLGLDDTTKRIRFLQQNRDEADAFLAASSFEKTVLGPVTQLLSDAHSETARLFEQNLRAMPDNVGLARVADEAIANFGLDPLERNARLQRQFQQAEEASLAADASRGRAGINREGLDLALAAAGFGWLQRTQDIWLEYDLPRLTGGDADASALELLEMRRNALLNPTPAYEGAERRPSTAAELEQAAALVPVIDVLKEILAEQKQQRADQARGRAAAPVNAHAE